MRKFLKKFAAMSMAVTMACGCFAGCGSEEEENRTITLTVYSETANVAGEQVGWSAKVLKDKFNVVLNIIPATDGVFETRMESGDLGDIVIFGGDDSYRQAVEAGLLYDWNEDNLLQEYGSYIYENMTSALEANQNFTSEITNGASNALYGFGHNVATSSEDHEAFMYTWDIRWDLYKQLNYPEVKNLDDLLEVFKQMKEICPTDENGNETYAASLWPNWDGDMVMYVKSLATAYYGYDEFAMGVYDPATGTYYDALQEDGPYLEMLKFFNKLYQNNLLDPNSMTQTYDDAAAKIKAGGAFWSIFNYAGCLAYNTDEHLAAGKMMCSLLPEEATPIVYGMNVSGGSRRWAIGANTDEPELCMEIINWLATPEGTMTYLYGPQGLCWDYDEDGYTYFTEFGNKTKIDRNTVMEGDYEGTGKFNDGCLQINNTIWSNNAVNPDSKVGEKYNWEFWKSAQEAAKSDIEQDWRDYFNVSSSNEYFESRDYVVAPATTYTQSSREGEFKTIWETVKDTVVTYSWRAIYANSDAEFDKIVDEMIEQANGYGYQQCVEYAIKEAEVRHQLEEDVRN